MPQRRSRLWLFAILALWLAPLASPGLAQTPDSTLIQPGRLSLDLSPAADSMLGLSLDALNTFLCQATTTRPVGECGLIASGSGSQPALILEVVQVEEPGGRQVFPNARVVPVALSLSGNDLQTACGPWSYQLSLDSESSQPVSSLELFPAASGAETAPFSGTLQISATLRFTQGAVAVGKPINLSLDLTGQWTVLLNSGGLDPEDSNLVLLVGRSGDRWEAAPAFATGECIPPDCRCGNRICLQGTQEMIDALNYSRPR